MKLNGKMAGFLAATSLLMLTACGGAGAADTTKITSAVKANAEAVVAAYNAHDAAKAASYDAPDYLGLFHGAAPVAGLAADEAEMKLQMEDPAVNWTVSDGSVTVAQAGDMAVYQAAYVFAYTDPGTRKPATERGNWVAIFKKQDDGTMKLWRSLGIDIPATSSSPAS